MSSIFSMGGYELFVYSACGIVIGGLLGMLWLSVKAYRRIKYVAQS